MIITRISEGLGNQLFQYALGRALAIKNELPLVLDLHFYDTTARRSFGLSPFRIDGRKATATDFRAIGVPNPAPQDLISKAVRVLYRFMETRKLLPARRFVLEPSFAFSSDILSIDHSCYVAGVWQSEKYFSAIADTLRKDLTVKDNGSPAYRVWAEKIEGTASVSLHVRRGDYVTSQQANALHGTMSLEYYARAIERISETVASPVFFVFSDDPAWAKENLSIPFPTEYVSDAALKDYEELMLMSLCAHHIIANSSFSWWGAWLGEMPDTLTIAPEHWFNDASIDTPDLIPSRWVRL